MNFTLVLYGPDGKPRLDENTNKNNLILSTGEFVEEIQHLKPPRFIASVEAKSKSKNQLLTSYAYSEGSEESRPVRIPPFLVVDQVNG